MIVPNLHYAELQDSYFFLRISEKSEAYLAAHPGEKLYKMGIGDISQPLCPAVIDALHQAVADQATMEHFHGYLLESGLHELRETIAKHYASRGVTLSPDEIFISSGAGDDLGELLDLFAPESRALVLEPAYPAYVDTNIMSGREIIHLPASCDCDFLPEPDEQIDADLIYICSPNNPTGAVFTREKLKTWVDFANRRGAVILFDAAYEAFVTDPALPHSIFEIEGAPTCAIEICSLSKTAGFTGTRLGYTALSKELVRHGMSLNAMWLRNRTTRTNGVSYILQKGAMAAFSPEGRRQIESQLALYRENASVLSAALDQTGLWYCGGKNSPYLWMQCPDGMKSWAFFEYLLHEIQVVGTPGIGFGDCGEGYFRFSSFGNPKDTREAAARLVSLLKR
ncbi:MAG: LL-diaminopimelate aminotransferase [Oscillospiraceae bacterium]|nr:LL-diaminopimelate aminotransferase [Oscillospiraceae bacterium]